MLNINDTQREARILVGYITCALWSEGLEQYSLSYEAKERAKKDVAEFIKQAGDTIKKYDPQRVGHDIWLTRNHHGAGFWDGDYSESFACEPGDDGDRLTRVCDQMGSVDLYKGDDNFLYFM